MGFKGGKSILSVIFLKHTKWIMLSELLAYGRATL